MVAKSYQSLTRLCDPFEENGKEYVIVVTKSGIEKKVRWYPEEIQVNYRALFAFFPDDSLYVARGSDDALETFFLQETHHFGRYCTRWGWYIGTWVKDLDVATIQAYKARMKELNISLYKMSYQNAFREEKKA